MLWFVWKARNNSIFKAKQPDPNTIVDLAQAHLQNFNRWQNKKEVGKPPNPNSPRRWIPPERGLLKLNVDGSWVHGEQVGSIARILRDHAGQLIDGFAQQVRASSPLQIETLAILEGLKFLQFREQLHVGEMEVDKVHQGQLVCETGSLSAEQNITGRAEPSWTVKPIVEQCRNLLSNSESMTLTYCLREANNAADLIAKMHQTSSLPQRWKSSPPPVLSEILCVESYLSTSCNFRT
ncbi:hypothetical protein ACJRO7_030544 [Eucalyptus globulus]|uniref:RNase H type-1 domain-containing protein n=1 Tax=Eucalyptus globulus TaxID=34317 RepID=A0ABD3JEH6_EUCGL